MSRTAHPLNGVRPSSGIGLIRSPYRFIEGFRVLDNGAAEACPRLPRPWPAWASTPLRTALPIEWAAQLYGVRARDGTNRAKRRGYLAGVKTFRWQGPSAPVAQVKVTPGALRGGFHQFHARFLCRDGVARARMTGTLYFPDGRGQAPRPVRPAAARDEARPGADPASAAPPDARPDASGPGRAEPAPAPDETPFRVVADRWPVGGYERLLDPNPDCPVYAGHFPGEPIVPGVLLLEAMIEAGCELVSGGERVYLAGVRDAVFQSLVRPGQGLVLRVDEPRPVDGFREFFASIACNGRGAARAKLALGVLGDGGGRFTMEA